MPQNYFFFNGSSNFFRPFDLMTYSVDNNIPNLPLRKALARSKPFQIIKRAGRIEAVPLYLPNGICMVTN